MTCENFTSNIVRIRYTRECCFEEKSDRLFYRVRSTFCKALENEEFDLILLARILKMYESRRESRRNLFYTFSFIRSYKMAGIFKTLLMLDKFKEY